MNKKFLSILRKHEKEDNKVIDSETELVQEIKKEFENSEEILNLSKMMSIPVRQFFSTEQFPLEWPTIPIRKSESFDIHKHTMSQRPYYHDHSFYELIYVHRGQCLQSYKVPDKQLILKEKQLCLLCPGAVHLIERSKKNDIILKMIIPIELFSRAINPILNGRTPDYFTVFESISEQVEYFIFKLLEECLQRGDFSENVIQSYLTLLFVELIRTPKKIHDEIEDKLNEYFENCIKKATLSDFAASLKYSEGYIGRYIKEKTGKSFSENINLFRLKKAAKMLAETELSIEAVSNEIGYSNTSGFYKQFYGFFGMTPKAYRKMFI